MSQPVWKLVANIGDAEPIDHGGTFVYIDETGVYTQECEMVIPIGEDEATSWEIRRFVLEPCTYIDGILSDNPSLPEMPAWFADSIDKIASYCGMPPFKFVNLLTSDDPIKRAWAWLAIGQYHGMDNLDEDPITFTDRAEVEARYDGQSQ